MHIKLTDELRDDEVGGGDEHDHSGHHSVDAQPDQAESINHHRRELPIGNDHLLFILFSHSLRQESRKKVDTLQEGSESGLLQANIFSLC